MRNDDLNTILAAALAPINQQLIMMESRTRDLATRGDLEKLRAEIMNGFVQSSALEPRLEALREQIAEIKEELNKAEDRTLTDQDRRWIRSGQVVSVVAFVIAALSFIFQHVHVS